MLVNKLVYRDEVVGYRLNLENGTVVDMCVEDYNALKPLFGDVVCGMDIGCSVSQGVPVVEGDGKAYFLGDKKYVNKLSDGLTVFDYYASQDVYLNDKYSTFDLSDCESDKFIFPNYLKLFKHCVKGIHTDMRCEHIDDLDGEYFDVSVKFDKIVDCLKFLYRYTSRLGITSEKLKYIAEFDCGEQSYEGVIEVGCSECEFVNNILNSFSYKSGLNRLNLHLGEFHVNYFDEIDYVYEAYRSLRLSSIEGFGCTHKADIDLDDSIINNL